MKHSLHAFTKLMQLCKVKTICDRFLITLKTFKMVQVEENRAANKNKILMSLHETSVSRNIDSWVAQCWEKFLNKFQSKIIFNQIIQATNYLSAMIFKTWKTICTKCSKLILRKTTWCYVSSWFLSLKQLCDKTEIKNKIYYLKLMSIGIKSEFAQMWMKILLVWTNEITTY